MNESLTNENENDLIARYADEWERELRDQFNQSIELERGQFIIIMSPNDGIPRGTN